MCTRHISPAGIVCCFQFQTCRLNLNNVDLHIDMSVTKLLLLKRNSVINYANDNQRTLTNDNRRFPFS